MATAIAVARYLSSKHSFGRVQMQKLVYYSQAWSLVWTGRGLFDEDIEAWKGGPVTPTVWAQQRDDLLAPGSQDLTSAEISIIDAVYAHYGAMGGALLSSMTHDEAPWRETWRDGAGRNDVIPTSAMRRAYTELSILEPRAVPAAPAPAGTADPTPAVLVRPVADAERARWRSLLDRLAKQ